MKQCKIVLDFLRGSDIGLEAKAVTIASAMKDNAYFPNPSPTLDELNAHIQDYSVALIAAKNRDRLKSSEKNDLRKKLEAVLVDLSKYVTAIAKGSKTILISSGFTVTPDSTSIVAVTNIEHFTVKQGVNSGQVLLKVTGMDEADSFAYYYSIADEENTVWENVMNTKSKIVLSGLKAGKTYRFYVKAVGSKDRSWLSAVITKTVF